MGVRHGPLIELDGRAHTLSLTGDPTSADENNVIMAIIGLCRTKLVAATGRRANADRLRPLPSDYELVIEHTDRCNH